MYNTAMSLRQFTLVCIVCLVVFGFNLISADDEVEQDRARKLHIDGKIVSLEIILKQAKKIHGGRILEVELEEKNGIYIYEIEIIGENGIVWELNFNASTAKLLSTEQED